MKITTAHLHLIPETVPCLHCDGYIPVAVETYRHIVMTTVECPHCEAAGAPRRTSESISSHLQLLADAGQLPIDLIDTAVQLGCTLPGVTGRHHLMDSGSGGDS